MQQYVISIDVGGTFTDCVVIGEDGRTAAAKARSTPADNFRSGFFDSIGAASAELGLDPTQALQQAVRISHGSTVATNIMVQGSGARVGLITTRGHEGTLRLAKGMGRVDDERIRLFRYYCPGCAAQLSVTVGRSDEEALSEFEIRA